MMKVSTTKTHLLKMNDSKLVYDHGLQEGINNQIYISVVQRSAI